MQRQFELLAAQALELLPEEREALAQMLFASLESDAVGDEALSTEVTRRVADIESGATEVIPMKQALEMVRARLK